MSFLGLLWMCLLGLLAGGFAKLLYPNNRSLTWPMTMLLGIAGSVVGGWIGKLLWIGDGSPGGFFTATVGALVLLFAYEKLSK